jgi:hypothetical protein
MVDKKYVRDYNKRVQKILLEEHGIRIDQKDIDTINTFLFRNIVFSLMRKVDVHIHGFLYFKTNVYRKMVQFLQEKKRALGKSTINPGHS